MSFLDPPDEPAVKNMYNAYIVRNPNTAIIINAITNNCGVYTNNTIYKKYPNANVAIPNCNEPDNVKVADNIIIPYINIYPRKL